MGEPRFRSDEPWGDYGEWFLLGGHVDKAEAFAEFDKTHRSYGGESFAEWGITVDDVLHGYATPSLYPPAGWEPDEWMQFSEQPWDETSIPVTILHAEGAGNVPTMADQTSPEPFGPPRPATVPVPPPDFGGRLIARNVHEDRQGVHRGR